MKRIKIMLLSLTLLAIVGGALAFKAKFVPEAICTTSTTQYDGTNLTSCPIPDTWAKKIGGFTTYYTTTQDDGDCSFFDGELKPLPCFNSTTLSTQE